MSPAAVKPEGPDGPDGPAIATPPVPFFLLNGLEVHAVGEGGAVCACEVRSWLDGAAELGIQAAAVALADCALNYAVAYRPREGRYPVSLGLRLDFWAPPPASGSRLTGTAEVEQAGGDAFLVRGRIEGPEGVVATATLRTLLVANDARPGPAGPGSSPTVEVVPGPADPWPPAAGPVDAVLSLPAAGLADLRVHRVGDGIVELTARPGAPLERTEGVVHGGAVPILGQLAGAAALASAFPGAPAAFRLDTNTEFLRPTFVNAPITIRARVVHRSRRVAAIHAEVLNQDGKPTARVYETAMLGQG